ncbi:integrin alpha-8-like [Amphiura filiformis]|uniref:integrin alpha-8-like n=1 Tax=Amphiura filiformis TaxID=82378 RepID=UPI003B217DA8
MPYMDHAKMILLLLVQLLLLTEFCTCFNVDTRAPVVHSGDLGTEFGFSVELHREQNTNWLLVGAPRAQTNQQGVDEGGAVFRCPVTPLSGPGQCTEIAFDTTGNPTEGSTQIGSKSNQRFGYTVESSGPDGPVVACAPLRLWYTPEGRYRFPVGGCFVARNNFREFDEMTPCQTDQPGDWKRLGPVYCQAGMSAAINEDTLVMGGPGSIYWQGSLYVEHFRTTQDPPPFRDEASLDDSYRGYSVALGEFNGDDMPDVAVGLPRAPDHKGQVKLYATSVSLTILKTFYGEQVGSYFGHSLAAIDINGDNLEDLIIGAPMYIDEDRSLEGWEAGKVYVYLQDPNASGNFAGSPNEVITGKRKRARFGFSVAAIGDMDRDGFNDFAVGAPYDGEDGTGAVYIFHGRRRSLLTTPAQIVYPSDLGLGIGTFGYSLASGLDMDNNAYIDLLVGAYNSSTAVLLRSRPVVEVSVIFSIHPQAVDLDKKDKQLSDGTLVAEFVIMTCITYTGVDVPQNMNLEFTLVLDSQRPALSSRAAFTSNNNYQISNEVRLIKDTPSCLTGEAYVRNNIRDRQSPIGILINYNLPFNESSMQPGEIAPILNQNKDSFAYQSVPLINKCKNFHCLPDLQLTASTVTTELIIGADEPIFLDIAVSNDGEDAFETVFIATFPEGLQFVRVERKQLDVSVTCNEDVDNNQITCDLGNPFPESHQVLFGIKLDNIGLLGDEPEANITMHVRSASQELQNTTADNFANITVDIKAQARINFAGVSDPIFYEILAVDEENMDENKDMDREITKEEDAGPRITHYYTLRNLGPSNIGPTTIDIKWPMWYSEGEYLLYLISATMGSGSTMEQQCEIFGGEANPDGLTLEPEKTRTNDSDVGGGAAALQGKPVRKRQVAEEQTQAAQQSIPFIDCDSSPNRCYNISCKTGGLMAGSVQLDSITIIIRSRLWLDTLSNIEDLREINIASTAEAKVQSMPYDIAPSQLPSETAEATLTVVPEILTPAPAKAIPLWVYVVSTMVGVFILCVIVLGLWKIGFFKRKKIQPNNPRAMVSDDNWVEDALQTEKQ